MQEVRNEMENTHSGRVLKSIGATHLKEKVGIQKSNLKCEKIYRKSGEK